MNLELLLAALRARLRLCAVVFASCVLAAAAVSLLLPKSYKASAKLLVDANKDEQSLSNVLVPPRERIGYLQTQMDIITSERVARRVVQALRLAEDPAAREAFEKDTGGAGTIEKWLIEGLLRLLKVETSQSNVIQLSFSSGDPGYAARVVNAFAQSYMDTMLELRVEPTRQAALWFDEQLKSLRASLEEAQARLTNYHRQQGIISADERYDVENARLGELSSQLVRTQDQTYELQAREALARRASPEELPDVLAHPHVQRLKADLAHGEARLQELATQYGAKHPQYQRLASENSSLREKVGAEMARVVAGVANTRRQSQQREAELKKALAAQRASLLEMKEGRNELTVLTRNVETAQRTYESALQRSVVSQVESRSSQTNIALLGPAMAPRRPSQPKTLLNIALAAIVGTMLGVGLAMLLELVDRRVRSRGDLEGLPEAPLLGELSAWMPAAHRALPSPA